MKKVLAWFKESNRYKHLAGGVIIGLLARDFSCSLFVSFIAAACLEYKDKAHGGKWDWIDFILTVFGAMCGTLFRFVISALIF